MTTTQNTDRPLSDILADELLITERVVRASTMDTPYKMGVRRGLAEAYSFATGIPADLVIDALSAIGFDRLNAWVRGDLDTRQVLVIKC